MNEMCFIFFLEKLSTFTPPLVSFADDFHHSLTLPQKLWITVCDNFSTTQQCG